MPEAPKAERYDSLLRAAARTLAETVASYGTVTRADLATRSGVDRWPSIEFDAALDCATTLGLIRRLDEDLYEARIAPPESG